MADVPFAWEDLARYKAEGRFLDGYPDDQRTFLATRKPGAMPPLPPAPGGSAGPDTGPGGSEAEGS
jgi:hypothetical protein